MKNKILYNFTLILCILLTACAKYENKHPLIIDLYDTAMKDAIWAEQNEIYPLFSLTDSKMATLSADNKQVLLLSWHNYPDAYTAGAEVNIENLVIWAFTDREIIQWYQNNSQTIDWNLRLKQLIGLPLESNYTHFTAFWVDINNVKRPAYMTNVFDTTMSNFFKIEPDPEYKNWFDNNILSSYFYSNYPWTRLGYTYDWASNSEDYGLSEFIILPHSEVTIEWTKGNDEFMLWLFKNDY